MTNKNAHKSPPDEGSVDNKRQTSKPSASQRAIDPHRFGSYEVAAEDRLRWMGENLPSMALEDTLPPTRVADPESPIPDASEYSPPAQVEMARADLDKTQPSLRARLKSRGVAPLPDRGSAVDRVKRFAVPLAIFLSVFVLSLWLLRWALRDEAPTLASPIASSTVGPATSAEDSEPERPAIAKPVRPPTLPTLPPPLSLPMLAVDGAAKPQAIVPSTGAGKSTVGDRVNASASRATSTRASASRASNSLDGGAARLGGPASAPSATSVPAPPARKSDAPDFEAPFTPQ